MNFTKIFFLFHNLRDSITTYLFHSYANPKGIDRTFYKYFFFLVSANNHWCEQQFFATSAINIKHCQSISKLKWCSPPDHKKHTYNYQTNNSTETRQTCSIAL